MLLKKKKKRKLVPMEKKLKKSDVTDGPDF